MSEPINTKLEKKSTNISERVNKTERSSVSLLIPWSCREGFTNDVCGLPGNKEGCWRYRETAGKVSVEDKDRGIRPSALKDLEETIVAWIVFESPVDGDGIHARVEESKPPLIHSHHQALFGFTKHGLEAFRIQTDSRDCADYPSYAEFIGVLGESGRAVDVKNWLRDQDDESDELGLADCFGQSTFIRQPIDSDIFDLRLDLSLSDLIRSYLNHNRDCRFRRDDSARGIGITVCKVGIELSKTPVLLQGAWPTGSKPKDLLSTSEVSFSYVDTETLNLKKLPQWCIGKHDCDFGDESDEYLRALHEKDFIPLRVRRFSRQVGAIQESEDSTVNFATSLSRYGRRSVLPTEVGKSFLTFSIGEITSYLLHWVLLRIFADENPQNLAFINAFVEWRNLLDADDPSHSELFSDLLKKQVIPILDPNIFTEAIPKSRREERFGIYDSPVAFGEALSFLGLSNGSSNAWIIPTLAFLRRFFDPNQSFQQLPMYKNLDWKESILLSRSTQLLSKEGQIEAAVACLANAAGLTFDENKTHLALGELEAHSKRSVFPIADVLATLPDVGKQTLYYYYIFPLWEDTIRDYAGQEWRGPVIFAHVLTWALPMEGDGRSPPENKIIEMGEQLQSILLPAGAAIAHGYYNQERENTEGFRLAQETAWKLARAWAHEVKNYTAPVIDDLNDADLQDSRLVSPEAREIINRSRRTILILNAASRAVQLSLSNKVGKAGAKASELNALKKLPRDRAEGIVEFVLQYLLNYRADVLRRDFTLNWTPRYTTEQTLDKLASLLGKNEWEDEKTILSDKRVIWVLALLREVIWNIRNEDPCIDHAGELGTVAISYDFSLVDNFLRLILVQRQIEEKGWGKSKAEVVGIELANTLFGKGKEAGGFGFIGKGEIQNETREADRGVEIKYSVTIDFALA